MMIIKIQWRNPKIKSVLMVSVVLLSIIFQMGFGLSMSPNTPTNPYPVDGATGVGSIFLFPFFSVDVSDGDGDILDVSFYDASNDHMVGTDFGVASGERASFEWLGLSEGTNYTWYAVADDGTSTTTSPTWNFTTNYAPKTPSNPVPVDDATRVTLNPTLSVDVSDVDSNNLEVHFYNASDDGFIGWDYSVSSGTASFMWSGLSEGIIYYWYAMVTDEALMTISPTWSFTTNYVPETPSNPDPADGATGIANIAMEPLLSVEVSDGDGDTLNVSFYDASDDSLIGTDFGVASGGRASFMWSGLLKGTSYNWYVIADDGMNVTTSPTWSFTMNYAPDAPSNPDPVDGATGIANIAMEPILSVDVYDGDGDTLNVSFYDASDDSLIGIDYGIASGGRASFEWSGLSEGTTYSWYVISDDGVSITSSPIWSFTTNYAPDIPSNPLPADGTTSIGLNPTLSVDISDTDGDLLDVSFYDASDDSLIGTDYGIASSGTASFMWLGLFEGMSYSWYAIADDGMNVTTSPTWSFTTNYAPEAPSNPDPADGSISIGLNPTLSVDISDNDGDLLDVSFYNASDDSLIGTDFGVASGGRASFMWLGLLEGMSYSWYAIADDGMNVTTSPTWSFTTNYAPEVPSNPDPADGSISIGLNPTLSVDISDNDGDLLDVSFYNASDDSLIGTDYGVVSGGRASFMWLGLLEGMSYSWYAIADDGMNVTTSPTWSFTMNYAPDPPSNPDPVDGATGIDNTAMEPILSVDVYDRDEETLDVTFYDASDDSLIGIDYRITSGGRASFEWLGLSEGTTYRWYVIADDGVSVTTSPTWSFTTNYAPDTPSNPLPADGAISIGLNPILSVNISDTDGDSLDVSFYNASDDGLIGTDYGVVSGGKASFEWSGLSEGTTYSWYAVIFDGITFTTSSVWSFETSIINPNISIITPTPNQVFGVNSPLYNIEVYDANLNTIWYTIDNGLTNFTFTDNGTINQAAWDLMPSGVIMICFYANDSFGGVGFNEIQVEKDDNAPSISIIAPVESETYELAPAFSVNISDANLDKIWYTLNDNPTKVFITSMTGSIDQTTWNSLSGGNVTIRFIVNDTVGNINYAGVVVRKETLHPGIPGYDLTFIFTTGIISVLGIVFYIRRKTHGKFK